MISVKKIYFTCPWPLSIAVLCGFFCILLFGLGAMLRQVYFCVQQVAPFYRVVLGLEILVQMGIGFNVIGPLPAVWGIHLVCRYFAFFP